MKYPEASFCSFCGRERHLTALLIQSGAVAICETCTGQCGQIVIERFTGVKEKLKTIRFEDGPEAVESDPERMGGVPVVAGTRYTLAQLLAELAEGHSLIEVADDQGLSFEACAAALRELAQSSSAPPGGLHRTANPELCVGTAENPDHRLRTENPAGRGELAAEVPQLTPEERAEIALEVRARHAAAVAEAKRISAELDEYSRLRAGRPNVGNKERAQELIRLILPLFPREYWEPRITAILEEALDEAEARGRT